MIEPRNKKLDVKKENKIKKNVGHALIYNFFKILNLLHCFFFNSFFKTLVSGPMASILPFFFFLDKCIIKNIKSQAIGCFFKNSVF